ncbi:hypothetical protein PFISCL1PPCAC_7224, partial [Pristionchus fissidentatus]
QSLAKTDKIGDVVLQVLQLLELFSEKPIPYNELQNSADSISAISNSVKENDSSKSQLQMKDFIRNYASLRDCCFEMADAVEFAARSMIANHSDDQAASCSSHPSDSHGYNESFAVGSTTDPVLNQTKAEDLESVSLFSEGLVKEKEAEGTRTEGVVKEEMEEAEQQTHFDPMGVCLLPKEEEEEHHEMMSDCEPGVSYSDDQTAHRRKRKADSDGAASSSFAPNFIVHQCSFCNVAFSDDDTLREHQQVHLGVFNDRPYKCPICPLTYVLQAHLDTHYTTCHSSKAIGYAHSRSVSRACEFTQTGNSIAAKRVDCAPSTSSVDAVERMGYSPMHD